MQGSLSGTICNSPGSYTQLQSRERDYKQCNSEFHWRRGFTVITGGIGPRIRANTVLSAHLTLKACPSFSTSTRNTPSPWRLGVIDQRRLAHYEAMQTIDLSLDIHL